MDHNTIQPIQQSIQPIQQPIQTSNRYSMYKYIIYAVMIYWFLTRYSMINTNKIAWTVVFLTVFVLILDNVNQFRPVCRKTYEVIPKITTASPIISPSTKLSSYSSIPKFETNIVPFSIMHSQTIHAPNTLLSTNNSQLNLENYYQPPLVQ